MKRPRVMDTYWRVRAERFWHLEFLEYLVEKLRFSPDAASLLVHMALNKRRGLKYAQ